MTKELFIESIQALMVQSDYDSKIATSISEAFSSFVSSYNNGRITTQILKLLREATGAFVIPEINMCDIEYFCYELDFGRKYVPGSVKDKDGKNISFATAEDLWNHLLNAELKVQVCDATGMP